MSSIPRSGSTLLGAILSQNPSVFVTPTSPLLDLLTHNEEAFSKITQAKTWNDPQQKINVSRGIIESIYRHIPRPFIVDKHRAWIKNIPTLGAILGYPPKFIYPVRDLAEVISSYMILVEKARASGKANFVDNQLQARGLAPTKENSAQVIFAEIRGNFDDLKAGLERYPDLIHTVDYRDLLADPKGIVDKIYGFLGLAPYFHEFDNIKPLIEEDDTFWGLDGLHTIRSALARTSPQPDEVLGADVCAHLRSLNAEFWRSANPKFT